MDEQDGDYLFLTGADMDPTLVRRAYSGGRFVARAVLAAEAGEVAPAFAPAVAGLSGGDVWGILVRVPAAIAGDVRRRPVTTDDGRAFTAALAGEHLVAGLPAATFAAARYWELPPAYTARLATALPAPGRDGGGQDGEG